MKTSKRMDALIYAYNIGYRVDKDGRVVSPRGVSLVLQVNANGYKYFNVRYRGKVRHVDVHRLQAAQKYGFQKMLEKGIETRHLDNCKLHNAVYNIAVGTHKENCNNTPKILLQHPEKRHAVSCQRGNIMNIFPSIYEASKYTGVDRGSISRAVRGIVKTAGGLIWHRVNYKIF